MTGIYENDVKQNKLQSNLDIILGDPGAESGGKGKSKRAEKYDMKKSKER